MEKEKLKDLMVEYIEIDEYQQALKQMIDNPSKYENLIFSLSQQQRYDKLNAQYIEEIIKREYANYEARQQIRRDYLKDRLDEIKLIARDSERKTTTTAKLLKLLIYSLPYLSLEEKGQIMGKKLDGVLGTERGYEIEE